MAVLSNICLFIAVGTFIALVLDVEHEKQLRKKYDKNTYDEYDGERVIVDVDMTKLSI